MPKRPICKTISYGSSKSVQLFVENELTESFKLGVLGVLKEKVLEKQEKQVFIVVVSEYYINGDLCSLAEYRYDKYMEADDHMHKIVLDDHMHKIVLDYHMHKIVLDDHMHKIVLDDHMHKIVLNFCYADLYQR